MATKTKEMLRWMGFIPGALAAAWLAWIAVNLLGRFSFGYVGAEPDSFTGKLYFFYCRPCRHGCSIRLLRCKDCPSQTALRCVYLRRGRLSPIRLSVVPIPDGSRLVGCMVTCQYDIWNWRGHFLHTQRRDALDLVGCTVCLWLVGQAGIVLELVGAFVIVVAAFRQKKKVAGLNATWVGIKHLDEVRKAIQGQATTEVRGFVLLGVGLLLQFIGGFST